MKPFIQDGHILVLRAVRALIGSNPRLVVEAIATVDWASATFVGKRHQCELRIEGDAQEIADALDRLARELPEVDVAACGHFLADCLLNRVELSRNAEETVAALTIEALTIAE